MYRITSAKTYRKGFYGGKVYTEVVSSWAFLLLPSLFLAIHTTQMAEMATVATLNTKGRFFPTFLFTTLPSSKRAF